MALKVTSYRIDAAGNEHRSEREIEGTDKDLHKSMLEAFAAPKADTLVIGPGAFEGFNQILEKS